MSGQEPTTASLVITIASDGGMVFEFTGNDQLMMQMSGAITCVQQWLTHAILKNNPLHITSHAPKQQQSQQEKYGKKMQNTTQFEQKANAEYDAEVEVTREEALASYYSARQTLTKRIQAINAAPGTGTFRINPTALMNL